MAINLYDIEFTSQGISQTLTTPTVNRRDEVYLDVYYREIAPDADSNIMEPLIGFETSRRLKLIWEVRVAEGSSPTPKYTDANGIPHWTFTIAVINRLANNSQITTPMIEDWRYKKIAARKKEYLHLQPNAATSWTVDHNLNAFYVGIEVFATDGASWVKIEPGKVARVSDNQLTIDFDGQSVAGHAIIRGITVF